jgi:hypothetical protein
MYVLLIIVCPFVLIFHNGQPSHGGDRKIFEVMTSTLPKGNLGSVALLLALTLYQGNPDRIISDIYTPYAGAAGMLIHINGKFTMRKLKMILNS